MGIGGSLDPHIGGTEAMKVKNFGNHLGGYKVGQFGLSPPSGIGVSAIYSHGTT